MIHENMIYHNSIHKDAMQIFAERTQ